MHLANFFYKKQKEWGVVKEDNIHVLDGPPYRKLKMTGEIVPLKRVRLLPPADPDKIILAGLNYCEHAHELGMKIPSQPVIFLKPPTALIGHKASIVYPPGVKQLDYEGELAVVIKKTAKNIHEKNAGKYILGYTCLNDVTARDVQSEDIQWTRAKSYDTFCPLGPWIETSLNPASLKIKTFLNGELKQSSCTRDFIFPVHFLVSFISHVMTLLPGDVISTGTPPGVGPMKAGDTIIVEIEGIGALKNNVMESAACK